MNYRSNNFPSYYENNPRLGYSNVSRGFGQSYRGTLDLIQPLSKIIILTKYNSCSKMKGKNSRRTRTSWNMILTMRENRGSSLKTNLSNLRTNSAEKMSQPQN